MKLSAKKKILLGILALCATMFLYVGCASKTPKAQGIRTSEPFENGTTFEFTDSVIELPYGIAYDKDGKDISLDLTYIIQNKEGTEIARSNDSIFDLEVGEYKIVYAYQEVTLEITFSVVDTVAPQIVFNSTNTGSMALPAGGGEVSASLPKYEISDYSACSVDEKLTFVSDDGTFNGEEYDYDRMGYIVEADRPGLFTYTIKATDASGNSATESVEWRCKDAEWTAADAQGDMVSTFATADYLDSVLNGEVYTEYTTNGNYYTEYLQEFEGAQGVVKIHSQFNTRGYSDFRFKLGKPVDLAANKNRSLVVRMFMPDAAAFGADIQIAGNTVSNRNFTSIVTVQRHALTRWYSVMTDNVGVVSGRWFNLSIPVSQLITLECSDQVTFKTPDVSDEEWFKNHTSYEYADDCNLEGMMRYLQFTLLLSGGSGYQDFYIDSIFLADRGEDADKNSFSVDFENKTIRWDAVDGAEYYNVFDESGALIASVDQPLFSATGLGEFASLRIVTVADGKADSAGITVTSTDLDITFLADGSWSYTPLLIAQSVSADGNSLTVVLNKQLEEGELDLSGVTATDNEGKAVELNARAENNLLIFDISDWKTSSQYVKQYVRIASGSSLKAGETTYFFNEDVILANLFGGWELVTESMVSRLEVTNGSNNNLRFYTYDENDVINSVPGSDFSAYLTEADASSTFTYSGSFTINGIELDTLVKLLPNDIVYRMVWAYVGSASGSSGVGMFYFQIMARIGDNWAWNLQDLCSMTGSEGIEVRIQGGTTVYMKFADNVYSLVFADTYTFAKASVTESSGGWSVEKTEGAVGQQKKYLVLIADENGLLYAGQAVDAGLTPDFALFEEAIGEDAEYIQGYYDGDTKIDTKEYTAEQDAVLTVLFDYPYLVVSDLTLSADGNALTLTVNKDLGNVTVTEADFNAVYADNTPISVSASQISAVGTSVTLDISAWEKSTVHDKTVVTIKAGSSFTAGDVTYTITEDITIVNLFFYDSETSPSRSWEILEKEYIRFDTIEVRNNTANQNLCFYLKDEEGNRLTESGLAGLKGYYFTSVTNTTALDYSGSVTVNGLQVNELFRQVNDISVAYVLALQYENGLYYFQLLSRTSAGAWVWNLNELCELLGSETVVLRIEAGTDLYLRCNGKTYAIHFADTYEFTKASASGNGDWSVLQTEAAVQPARYIVRFTDQNGTSLGGQIVEQNGKIDFAKAFGVRADYIAKFTVGSDGTEYTPGENNYVVTETVTVKVTFEYNKPEVAGQMYTMYTEQSTVLALDVLSEYYFKSGVADVVEWTLNGSYANVTLEQGELKVSGDYTGVVNLRATVYGITYDCSVSVLVSEQQPIRTVAVDGAVKTDQLMEHFYARFTSYGIVLAKGIDEESSLYILGVGFTYTGSIKLSGIELTDFAGMGYDVCIMQDSVGYLFAVRQTGSLQWEPVTQSLIGQIQSGNDYPDALLSVSAGTEILLEGDTENTLLSFADPLAIVKNCAPSVAEMVAAIGDYSSISPTNFGVVLLDADGNKVDGTINNTELYYNGNQPASASNKATFYYFGSIKICGVELSELLTSDQAKGEDGKALFGTRYGGWARLYGVSDNYQIQLYIASTQTYTGTWPAFNGFAYPTVEFSEGTVLFVTNANTAGSATSSQHLEFANSVIAVKNHAGYLRDNVIQVYGGMDVRSENEKNQGSFVFGFTDAEGNVIGFENFGADIRFFDGRYTGQGLYNGSIKVCGVELSELASYKENDQPMFGTQYSTTVQMIYSASGGGGIFMRLATADNVLVADWNAFNGYETRTITFEKGTMLMLFGNDNVNNPVYFFEFVNDVTIELV